MELRTITYFTQLCEDLNFTVAAGKLYVTQQALSKAIANLEAELGVQLFIRGKSGLSLTEFGEAFREEVEPAIEAIDRASKKIEYMKDLNHVCIHFGFVMGIYAAMDRLIEDFCAENPNIEIVGEEGFDAKCESDFQAGVYDIICVTEPPDSTDFIPIYESPLALVVAKGGALDCEITPEMLSERRLIDYGSEFNMTKRVRAAFERKGLNLTMRPATSDKTAHYSGMHKGKLAMLMSEHEAIEFTAKNPETTYKPFPFDEEDSVWRLSIKYNENAVASEELRLFVDFLQAKAENYVRESFHDIYSF